MLTSPPLHDDLVAWSLTWLSTFAVSSPTGSSCQLPTRRKGTHVALHLQCKDCLLYRLYGGLCAGFVPPPLQAGVNQQIPTS
mmetsp:Transcript_60425/g.107747  ORF Transcript_60425/g.107747 Transcript_60425/m.107747 type:complete len:82 (-) Transcript_60425:171-416(-)